MKMVEIDKVNNMVDKKEQEVEFNTTNYLGIVFIIIGVLLLFSGDAGVFLGFLSIIGGFYAILNSEEIEKEKRLMYKKILNEIKKITKKTYQHYQ